MIFFPIKNIPKQKLMGKLSPILHQIKAKIYKSYFKILKQKSTNALSPVSETTTFDIENRFFLPEENFPYKIFLQKIKPLTKSQKRNDSHYCTSHLNFPHTISQDITIKETVK